MRRNRRQNQKVQKSCPFKKAGVKPEEIDFADVDLLKHFTMMTGKILPARVTGVSPKHQKMLTLAIKRARIIGLMPFINRKGQ